MYTRRRKRRRKWGRFEQSNPQLTVLGGECMHDCVRGENTQKELGEVAFPAAAADRTKSTH